MGVRNELYGQLIEVVNKNHDDEPEIQPSRPIGRNDLLLCSQAEVPERMLRPLEPIWGICYHQQDDAFIIINSNNLDILRGVPRGAHMASHFFAFKHLARILTLAS